MKCEKCDKEMNPVDAMLSKVCTNCTRKAHKEATGQLTAKERYEKHEKSGRNAEYRRGVSGNAQV